MTTPAIDATEPSSTPPPSPRRPSRWWMAAVPVAIVAMLAANGYRAPVFWYQSGLHHEIASGDANTWVKVSEDYTDAQGDTTRDYSVRLVGLGGADTAYARKSGDDFTLKDGMVARTVNLDFSADPSQPLKNCALTLIDDQGREYRVGTIFDDIGPTTTVCVPKETPGPSIPLLSGQPRGVVDKGQDPRPGEWSASPAIAVPEDAKLVEVRISFEYPDYVTLRLPL